MIGERHRSQRAPGWQRAHQASPDSYQVGHLPWTILFNIKWDGGKCQIARHGLTTFIKPKAKPLFCQDDVDILNEHVYKAYRECLLPDPLELIWST